jgi:hypothetical protein
MGKNNSGKPRLSVLLRALASLSLCVNAKSQGRKAARNDGLMGLGQGWNKSTPAFASKLRRDTQVVDIPSKMAKSRVVSRLISRRLRRKPAFFDPFLTRKGVDFSALTKKVLDFLKILIWKSEIQERVSCFCDFQILRSGWE